MLRDGIVREDLGGAVVALSVYTAAQAHGRQGAVAKKPKRDRTLRREAARAAAALATDRERLFALEPGGSAGRPIEVDAVPIVELRAVAVACPRCAGRHRVEEHAAVTVAGDRLREARLVCSQCGSRRSLWFRLPVLN